MRKQLGEYTHQLNKVAFSKIKAAFFALSLTLFITTTFSSCFSRPIGARSSSLKVDQGPRILNTRLTHSVFKKWTENNYQSSSDHTITLKSHHPEISDSSLKSQPDITSGYTIDRFTNRTEGIGLPSLIRIKENIFTPVTSDTYQSNLRPVTIVATQSLKNGQLQTHFDIYHPYNDTHNGHALKRQPNIVMEYIQDLPGNSSLDIKGLIKPSKYSQHQGFYLAEPYDKERIPIVMVHGLASSPATYAKMSDAINAHPALRKKYQLWFYFYPTGTPWLVTASKFRNSFRNLIKELDPDKNDKNLRDITLIGHSMGGLISRVSLSEPKNIIQQAYFGDTSLDQIFTKDNLKSVRSYFHFEPLTEPSRAPHRGSRIAQGLIGSITIKLITLPTNIIKQTTNALITGKLTGVSIPEQSKKLLTKGESSINQLQPNNPSLKALNQMQIRNVIYVERKKLSMRYCTSSLTNR